MSWVLDPQLEADSFRIASLNLCELRLFDHQDWVWLILIPMREKKVELLDLEPCDQALLLEEIGQVSRLLKRDFPCDKLNIALLGNVVTQLHVHVIARRFDDPCFPKVPFGLPRVSYQPEIRIPMIQKIQSGL